MKAYCSYMKREGYCAKGNLCEFSHDKALANIVCQAYASGLKCRFGSACSFSHKLPSRSSTSSTVVKSTKADESSKSYSKTSNNDSTERAIPNNSVKPKSIWGFDEDQQEGVYFYGAPGSFPSKGPDSSDSSSYASATKLNGVVDNEDIAPPIQEKSSQKKSQEICPFYISGTCRFGSFCRNSHDIPNIDNSLLSNSIKSSDDSSLECGICISVPEDGMYGLLNNCDCIFCLKCIREWRKDGLEITKVSQQVRKCPLCRTISYFICPSPKVLKGEAKYSALEGYKTSLKKIVCKHYNQGHCPFGSSCFYKHVNPDGSEEHSLKPRIVLNAAAEPEYRGNSVSLSSFIVPKLT